MVTCLRSVSAPTLMGLFVRAQHAGGGRGEDPTRTRLIGSRLRHAFVLQQLVAAARLMLLIRPCSACHVMHFYHIPKTGGTAMDNAWWQAGATGSKVKLFQMYGSPSSTGFNFTREASRLEERIAAMPADMVLYVAQHHMAPGLLESAPFVLRWRAMAHAKGCNYTAFTVLREPLDRMASAYYYNKWNLDMLAEAAAAGTMDSGPAGTLARHLDNNMVRYLINNHGSMAQYRAIGSVDRESADLALELLRNLDVVADMRCLHAVSTFLLKSAGLPEAHLRPINVGHNQDRRQGPEHERVTEFLKPHVQWDSYLYDKAKNLSNFFRCANFPAAYVERPQRRGHPAAAASKLTMD